MSKNVAKSSLFISGFLSIQCGSRWFGGGGCSTFDRRALSHLWGMENEWEVYGSREICREFRSAQSVSIERRNCSDKTCLLRISPWSKALQFSSDRVLSCSLFFCTLLVWWQCEAEFSCVEASLCASARRVSVWGLWQWSKEIIFVGKSLRNEIESRSDVCAISTRRIRYWYDAKRKDGNKELPRNVDYVNEMIFHFDLKALPDYVIFFVPFASSLALAGLALAANLAEIISAQRVFVKRSAPAVAK